MYQKLDNLRHSANLYLSYSYFTLILLYNYFLVAWKNETFGSVAVVTDVSSAKILC